MKNCIFCKIAKKEEKSWKVYEDENTYAFLNIHPVDKYHILIIPKNHYKDIFDIPLEELKHVISTIKKLTTLLKEKIGIENVQIINSSGVEAQQDVFHIHFHIVPRKKGDGQDIKWTTHPEYIDEYDELLKKLE